MPGRVLTEGINRSAGLTARRRAVSAVTMVRWLEAANMQVSCRCRVFVSFLSIVIFRFYRKGRQNKLECFMMLHSNFFFPFKALGKNVLDL